MFTIVSVVMGVSIGQNGSITRSVRYSHCHHWHNPKTITMANNGHVTCKQTLKMSTTGTNSDFLFAHMYKTNFHLKTKKKLF